MSSGSSGKKGLTRRSLLSIAGGAAGLLTAKKIVGRGPAVVAPATIPAAKDTVPAVADATTPAAASVQAKAATESKLVQRTVAEARSTLSKATVSTSSLAPSADFVPEADLLDANNIAYELPPATQQVLSLLSPLRPGARLYGWTVVSIHDVHMGAIPVILQDADGRRFQVDICRKDGEGPRAVADTDTFSLFLANSGNGRTPSNESHGLGAIALATVLTRREKRGMPNGVMTLKERSRRFPNGSYAAPA